jgi:hypothetical protein
MCDACSLPQGVGPKHVTLCTTCSLIIGHQCTCAQGQPHLDSTTKLCYKCKCGLGGEKKEKDKEPGKCACNVCGKVVG